MANEHIDPLDVEAQIEAKEKREEVERLARLIEIEDFKFVMAHKQGRRFIGRLLDRYGVFRTSFSTEQLEMARLEGQRNCGLDLMAMISEHTPDRYIELLTERKNDARADNGSRSARPRSTRTRGAGTDDS